MKISSWHRLRVQGLALGSGLALFLLSGTQGVAGETYSQTLLRALDRYQSPKQVPSASIRWISRHHRQEAKQVQADLGEYFRGVYYHQTLEEAGSRVSQAQVQDLSQRFGRSPEQIRTDLEKGPGSLPPELLARFQKSVLSLEKRGVLASLKRVLAQRQAEARASTPTAARILSQIGQSPTP